MAVTNGLSLALEHWRGGDLGGARKRCLDILDRNPNDHFALNLLAELAASTGNARAAIDYWTRAISVGPQDAATLRRLANAQFEVGDREDAIASYQKAIDLQPENARAHNNLGRVLGHVGDLGAARASYERALDLDPNYPVAHANLSALLNETGEHARALQHAELAVQLRPELPEAWHFCAISLARLRRHGDALQRCSRALALKPNYPEAWLTQAEILHDLDRLDEAMASCDTALSLRPDYAAALYGRGKLLRDLGDWRNSVRAFEHAARAEPALAAARMAAVMAHIPALVANESDQRQTRGEFLASLDRLSRETTDAPAKEAVQLIGALQPFYLAYQIENNRDLLATYGRFCVRLMQAWQSSHGLDARPRLIVRGSRQRVGIVSAQIRHHSVHMALSRAWLRLLDRRHFEIHVFHVGAISDAETEAAVPLSQGFARGVKPLAEWARMIRERDLDILIYPEVGMDGLTLQLASMRLAPIQAVAWGHPETSGLPRIDYYLSADGFEPADGERHYVEKLVRLPNLGSYFEPSKYTETAIDRFPIDWSKPVMLCAGTPFKYGYENDQVLIEIAKRCPDARFYFFSHRGGALSRRLQARLSETFAAASLDVDRHVVLLPWASQIEFHTLMQRADLLLDTIGFSGFNTVMQAVECGLPIVTRRGDYLRGRFGSGILERIDLRELVTASNAGYADLVVELAADASRRGALRVQLRERGAKLFRDGAAIKGLQDFLLERAPTGL